jgi:hypothetical protein
MAASFYKELKKGDCDTSNSRNSAILAPRCVLVMHAAFAGTQEAMPEAPNNNAGCTAVACWIEHEPTTQTHAQTQPSRPLTVYAGCCGDSQVLPAPPTSEHVGLHVLAPIVSCSCIGLP